MAASDYWDRPLAPWLGRGWEEPLPGMVTPAAEEKPKEPEVPEEPQEKLDVIDFLLRPEMQGLYSLGAILLLVKAARDEKVQKRLTDLLAKLSDSTAKIKDVAEGALFVGLAYVGYKAVGSWPGLLVGPIGLKLAQSGNIVSAGAGLAILSGLGLASVAKGIEHVVPAESGDIYNPDVKPVCPTKAYANYIPIWLESEKKWICVVSPSGLY